MNNIFDSMLSDDDSHSSEKSQSSARPIEANETKFQQSDVELEHSQSNDSTPRDVKDVVQELLRQGFIEEARKTSLFQKCLIYRNAILAALEPFDLTFQLDEHRGIAFLKVDKIAGGDDGQEWSHPLVRRKRLTLEQSLLVAILRQIFIANEQEAGVGEVSTKVAVEDLLPQFLTYFEDSGSDAKNESRLSNILDQLKTHGIVSEVDKKQEVTIRPLIAHVADPASLAALLHTLQEQADLDGFDQGFHTQEKAQ